MTLREIRAILLQQHASLREKIEDARSATKLWRVGDWSRGDLQERLQRLADQLRAHNACEEGLLVNVLPTIDAGDRLATTLSPRCISKSTGIYAAD